MTICRSDLMADATELFQRDLEAMRQRRAMWDRAFTDDGRSRRPDRVWGNLPRPLRSERHRADSFWRD
jgi:hypothetical protein